MDTIPGRKQALQTQASPLARSALCGDGERRAPWALAGHHPRALAPGRVLSSLLQVLGNQPWRQLSESSRPDGMESGNSGQQERCSALGWEGRVSGYSGRARLLNFAFANHFLSLFSGGSTPRPPEMTSESFASRCLYLPCPAGTLSRRPHGQRVG